MRIFAVGGDSKAYVTEESAPNASYNSWTGMGDGTFKSLAVQTNAAGNVNLVAVSVDGNVSETVK